LISRGDQASQRSLAHEARVYDRRANAYLDALRYLQSLESTIGDADLALVNERKVDVRVKAADPSLRASLSAYASPAAARAFDVAVEKGRTTIDLAAGVDSASGSERDRGFATFAAARDRFHSDLSRFQEIVRREIG
jgi:hypothetical protein